MKDYIVYLIYKFFQFFFKITPNFLLKNILILIAKIIYLLNTKHKKIIDINLDLAFDNKLTKEEKENISSESYKSLIFNMFEFIENQYLSKNGIFEKANIENEDVILDAIKNKRKIIFISAHYGGWELAVPFIALKYGTVAIVNRKMNNPYIQKMYAKARDNNNIEMLEKSVAAKGMIKAFKENKFVCVVIDQHIKAGVEIEFFGQKVLATDATSRIALKFDSLIIPIFSVMNDFRDYTIKIGDPIDVAKYEFKTEDKINELTQIQNNILEEQIKSKPEQWFWQHKRFKYKHKDLYK